MRKLMKSLMAVSAVLSLAPTAAFALPPQCNRVCAVSAWDEECYNYQIGRASCRERVL